MVLIPIIQVLNQVCPKALFLAFDYFNDLERNIKSNINLFADVTMLFTIVKNPEMSANDQWKLEFHPDTTKQATEVLFSCEKSSPNHPQIMFNGTVVAKNK